MNQFRTKYDFKNAKTEKAIIDAFLELSLQGKRFSVADICQRAGVNRSTFYRHYEDIDDLINECRGDMLLELEKVFSALIKPESFDADGHIKRSVIMRLLRICRYKRKEILVLLEMNPEPGVRSDLIEITSTIIEEVFGRYEWKNSAYRSYAALLASGSIYMIVQWLKAEDLSMEEFGKLFTAYIYNAIDLTRNIVDMV